jgi:hypothetical protein
MQIIKMRNDQIKNRFTIYTVLKAKLKEIIELAREIEYLTQKDSHENTGEKSQ